MRDILINHTPMYFNGLRACNGITLPFTHFIIWGL